MTASGRKARQSFPQGVDATPDYASEASDNEDNPPSST
jgi:hypothetical protein